MCWSQREARDPSHRSTSIPATIDAEERAASIVQPHASIPMLPSANGRPYVSLPRMHASSRTAGPLTFFQ